MSGLRHHVYAESTGRVHCKTCRFTAGEGQWSPNKAVAVAALHSVRPDLSTARLLDFLDAPATLPTEVVTPE